MLRVLRIIPQQFTGQFGALSAMGKSSVLAALRHRAFPMEGMTHCLDAALASVAFFILTACAVQAATGIGDAH